MVINENWFPPKNWMLPKITFLAQYCGRSFWVTSKFFWGNQFPYITTATWPSIKKFCGQLFLWEFFCVFDYQSRARNIKFYINVAKSYINLHRKNCLPNSYRFPTIYDFFHLFESLLAIFRQYKSCKNLIFCMNIHNYIVHHYSKYCISSF